MPRTKALSILAIGLVLASCHEFSFGDTNVNSAAKNLVRSRAGWNHLHDQSSHPVATKTTDQAILIRSQCKPEIEGLYHETPLKGHFELEGKFQDLMNGGLALVATKAGELDLGNYLMVVFEKNSQGNYVFRVQDMQKGKPDVFDSTGQLAKSYAKGPLAKLYNNDGLTGMFGSANSTTKKNIEELIADRYSHVLDGGYSVSFDKPNGRIKISRNGISNTFHLYYGISKKFGKERRDGWIEFAPVRDWMGKKTKWYPALAIARDSSGKQGKIECSQLATRKPRKEDIKPKEAEFAVSERAYTWSGFEGDATVVTFDEAFPFSDQNIKFVFWERANFIPVWHLSNQLLFCYEFVETWDQNGIGCYEPMSDRLTATSKVKVLEDNSVRKRIQWNYVLLNPNYQTPDHGKGSQLPEAEEIYTIYPDGRIIRHITYRPKLDGEHRRWNELSELIVVAGNRFNPGELLGTPALTVLNNRDKQMEFFPDRPSELKESEQWKRLVAAVHFQDKPDAIVAFSNASDTPDTHPGVPVRANVSWHGRGYRMAHWPVGLEPYLSKDKSPGSFRAQVSHTSLLGVGAHKGAQWKNSYKIDTRGRRTRNWASLLALTDPGDSEKALLLTNSWMYPGNLLKQDSADVQFMKHDRQQGEIILKARKEADRLQFTWQVAAKSQHIYKPCFRLKGFAPSDAVVRCNERELAAEKEFRVHLEGDDLLLWLDIVSQEPLSIEITARN